jgi:hypothetical protein
LEGISVHKGMKIVTGIFATVGLAYVVKRIMHSKEGRCLCGWHKVKVEDEKPTSETESHKTKEDEEKRTGSRYGSNPIRY